MIPLVWMSGVALISWLLVSWLAPQPLNPELGFAMAGPLASVAVTWVVTARTQRSDPARVTSVLVMGLIAKMVFFGVYVVCMVRLVGLRPVPFVVAFAAYFIGLYGMEALFLKRLFADGMRSAPRA